MGPKVDSHPGSEEQSADLFETCAEPPLVAGRRNTAALVADILAASEDLSS